MVGREWTKKFNDVLLRMRFMRCLDTCVYVRRDGSNLNIIVIYVDGILLACSTESNMKSIVLHLNKSVEAVNRGPISFYLGMEIERDNLRGDLQFTKDARNFRTMRYWQL